MARLYIYVLAMLLLFSPAAALVTADYASPQIVEKPLLVTPGQPVSVPIYNGGKYAWTDLEVSVAGGPVAYSRGVLEPEGFASVDVPVPLIYLLSADALEVTLGYAGTTIDARSLPVRVDWPKQLAVVDPYAPAGPEFVILMDESQLERRLGGVQVEVAILDGDEVVYFDFFGPFYLAPDERFVWRSTIPDRYLMKGDFGVRATFYEGGYFLAETTSTFSYGKDADASLAPFLLILITVLLLVSFYLAMDMIYHARPLRESLRRLRR